MKQNRLNLSKEKTHYLFNIIGQQLNRHSFLLIVVLSFILLLNVLFTVTWAISPDEVPQSTEVFFYIVQSLFFLVTIAAIILIFLNRKGKFKDLFLAVANHIYAAFLILVATFIFCQDLSLGFAPLTYLLIMTFVAGIFVVDPIFFAIAELLSIIPISISVTRHPERFFGATYLAENLIVLISFVLLIIVICFKNYRVINADYKLHKKLHELSYKDELTGLLNERSYVDTITDIDKRINNGEDVKFAVILMDVNNLKATNDAYGHQYGCSLVVRCGHTLPTLFKEPTKLFHVGGDEFLAIVMGEDLERFEERMAEFDKAMLYSIVEYKGQNLIFSVARGYKIRENGQLFKDVLQIADEAMYANKKMLKEKYNMKGR